MTFPTRIAKAFALPEGSEETVLLDSSKANLQHARRYVATIAHDETGTVTGEWSSDGAVWTSFYSEEFATTDTVVSSEVDQYIAPFRYFRFKWLNGGTDQETFRVSQVLDDER